MVLAGEDPADLGILYGKIWAAVAGLWPALERAFVIRRKNVEITCDFAASETLVAAAGDVTLTLGPGRLSYGPVWGPGFAGIFENQKI